MEQHILDKNCILICDDDFINRELLKNIFSSQFTFEEADNGKDGLALIHKHKDKLCAIILDVEMPEMTGIEILEQINKEGITKLIPTFLITARDDYEILDIAYRYGVMDVVLKPVTSLVVERRVKSVIELFNAREQLNAKVLGQEARLLENAREMDELHRGTLEALATAIEFRDIESGQHVSRIYGITKYILSKTSFGEGLTEIEIENIARGSIMHDVGKIAISDVILNKPGKLTKEQFEEMKLHTIKGAELLEQILEIQIHDSYVYAVDIARHHHEKWDGKGYPDGLIADEISIAAQVVSIADVYDALVSIRVYKAAYTPDEAVQMIVNGECGQFNPKLIKCFLEVEPVIRKWYTSDEEDEIFNSLIATSKHINTSYKNNETKGNVNNSVVNDLILVMTAIQSTYDMVIYANLTQNTYHIMDYDRFLTHYAQPDGCFDDLIEAGTASIPSSHRREFNETFSRSNLLNVYYSGKKSISLEHPQFSDDGNLHWVLTTVLFIKDNRTGDILEITTAKYIDEEYEQRNKTRQVLTDAFNLAEQANNAKYSFLSKMSHDIRTPLNAIIGMTTVIAANLENKDKISDCLVKIGTSSKYLLGIINDVLDYTKLKGGSLAIHKADFNFRDLITNISNEMVFKTHQKHQVFSVNMSDEISNSYIGDEYRTRQIITNLLDNAHKYTGEGGKITLNINLNRHTSEYDLLSFEVIDNGIGIKKELLSKLFEPFAQGDGVDDIQSVGLGLPIARNLAHLMNGEIVVKSELGKGSTFTFEIPLEHGSLIEYTNIIDQKLNVLVVDDEIAVCEHTAILLHNMGIEAEITDNGFDAIKKIENNLNSEKAFDIAIIDWKMPEMDGIQTVRKIRKLVGNDVLVAIMSAYDWSEIEQEAREAGVDLFIAKPILETSLRTAIACSERIIKEHQSLLFNGEKILVVEDNEFNIEIAKTILEMKNLTVDVAENGKVAYEKFLASHDDEYTAIFMDILMPVMNGLDATRAIRSSNHPKSKTIPIYAMSANAFQSDILEAKMVGMDGHIAKPVDFEEVVRLLHTIVKNKQSVDNSTRKGLNMTSYETLIKTGINIDALRNRLMGNDSLVRVFIKKFIEDNTFNELKMAFVEKDMKQAEMKSHTLKGMCGNLSLDGLFNMFSEQTNLIRSKEYSKAESMMPSITEVYNNVILYMKEWLQEA